MSVRSLLNDEIKRELEEIERLQEGSEAQKIAIENVTKLLGKAIEMDKNELEYQDRFESRELEKYLKEKGMKDEKIDRLIKNGLTLATFVGGAGLTIWGTLATFEFEKEGTVTSLIGRLHLNKLLPKK